MTENEVAALISLFTCVRSEVEQLVTKHRPIVDDCDGRSLLTLFSIMSSRNRSSTLYYTFYSSIKTKHR